MQIVNYTERERAVIPIIEELMRKNIPELPDSSRRQAQASERALKAQNALLKEMMRLKQATPAQLLALLKEQDPSFWNVQRVSGNLAILQDKKLLTSYRAGSYHRGETVYVYQGTPDGEGPC